METKCIGSVQTTSCWGLGTQLGMHKMRLRNEMQGEKHGQMLQLLLQS